MNDSTNPSRPRTTLGRVLVSVGPALITASVVLGPGSILSASKIGQQYGYQMTWVLLVSVLLMVSMTALSARLGVMFDGTLCEELAKRANRPLAVFVGLAIFLIVACYQFSNNLGILAAIEPFYDAEKSKYFPYMAIAGLNGFILIALFGFKSLYLPIERLMKFLVGLMIIGFAGNLLLARPSIAQTLAGLMPQFPEGAWETLLPRWQEKVVENGNVVQEAGVIDNLLPVTALFGTTFSIAGAFYQSYLVRQKGWTRSDLREGFIDSTVGISTLGLLTMMILMTAAAVLHQNESVTELSSATDVARQLEPAFGTKAKVLFCLGIFAGAFSSFLVNAMIGGSMMSDGLGLGGYIDQRWPKIFTALALLSGMVVAMFVQWQGQRPVNLIIFAQALTVLGFPILAIAMLWLATRPDLKGERSIPGWMKVAAVVSLVLTTFLALRTAAKMLLPIIYG